MTDIGTSKMMRIRDVSEQVKLAYDDMNITSSQIQNLMEKHHSQQERFLKCCIKLKEILNNEDSI